MTQDKKIKLIITATILIDVLGIGIIIPLMPYYIKQFNTSPLAVTFLIATYSLCSFVSAPFLGSLSDKIGRRKVLLMSIFSSSIGWLIFASANQLWLLFLAKIIDGAAAGNYSTAQSVLSDIARDEKERTANLGLAGALFGIGLIIGPALGGVLSTLGPRVPFFVVSAMALINVTFGFFMLPETNKHIDAEKKVDWHPIKPLLRAWKDKKLRQLYAVLFLVVLAAVSMQSVFSLYLDRMRGLSAGQVASIMTIVGVLIAINQGFLLKKFWLPNFSEDKLRFGGIVAYGLALILLPLAHGPWFYLCLLLMVTGQSIGSVTINSQIDRLAGPQKRGEAYGVMSALQSFVAVIAPIAAGLIFTAHSAWPFYFAGLAAFAAAILESLLKNSKKSIANT